MNERLNDFKKLQPQNSQINETQISFKKMNTGRNNRKCVLLQYSKWYVRLSSDHEEIKLKSDLLTKSEGGKTQAEF